MYVCVFDGFKWFEFGSMNLAAALAMERRVRGALKETEKKGEGVRDIVESFFHANEVIFGKWF